MGFVSIRCRDCHCRFTRTYWDLSNWKYAHCPRCFRVDLTYWSETHYHVTFGQQFRIALGAKRYRCEVCRCNFTSFARLKKRYRFRTHKPADAVTNSPAAQAEVSPRGEEAIKSGK